MCLSCRVTCCISVSVTNSVTSAHPHCLGSPRGAPLPLTLWQSMELPGMEARECSNCQTLWIKMCAGSMGCSNACSAEPPTAVAQGRARLVQVSLLPAILHNAKGTWVTAWSLLKSLLEQLPTCCLLLEVGTCMPKAGKQMVALQI